MTVADVNKDGLKDILAGCPWRWINASEQGSLALWTRKADGTYNAVTYYQDSTLESGAKCGASIDVADVNGDGWLDAAMGCNGHDQGGTNVGAVVLFTGTSSGFVWESRTVPSGMPTDESCGRSVQLADVGGDGRGDLVVGCSGSSTTTGQALVLMRNATNDGFDTGGASLVPSGATTGDACGLGMTTADFNGDGSVDVAVACLYNPVGSNWNVGATDFFYWQPATSNFSGPSDRVTAATIANDQRCGDFVNSGDGNGDGLVDVIVGCGKAGGSGGAIVALRRRDNAGWETAQMFMPTNPQTDEICGTSVGMGDVDGDGRDEGAFGCFRWMPSGTTLLIGRAFVVRIAPSVETTIAGAAAGDQCGKTNSAGIGSRNADVDGDGIDDLVTSCERAVVSGVTSGRVVVRESSTGTWRSLEAPTPANGELCGSSVAVADFNGDGLDDVAMGCVNRVVGGAVTGAAEVFLRRATNDGFDHHVQVTNPTPLAGDRCADSLAAGDVDGDLRPDLVLGCSDDDDRATDAGTIWVARRTSATAFAPVEEATRAVANAYDACGGAMDVGDVDGDGIAEVSSGCGTATVGGQSQAGRVVILKRRADGSGWDELGSFSKPTPAASDACQHHALGDVDGNGLRDLVMSCHYDDTLATDSGRLYVFRSTGAGAFTAAETVTQPSSSGAVCGMPTLSADVNLDGRDDIVIGCRHHPVSGFAQAGLAVVLTRDSANTGFDAALTLANPTPVAYDKCADAIAVGNFRHGGRPDVVLSCSGDDTSGTDSGNLVEFRNRTAGTFSSGQGVRSMSVPTPAGVVAGARVDIATVRHGMPDAQLLLSADGGVTWEAATNGTFHAFATPGSDLRVRADFPLPTGAVRFAYVHALKVTPNMAPTVTSLTPAADAVTADTTPTLGAMFNDTDSGATGTLQFQVCANATCTAVGDPMQSGSSASGLTSGTAATWDVPAALSHGEHWWRVRAVDELGGSSTWSTPRRIVVGAAPTVTQLLPASGGVTSDTTPDLSARFNDADAGDTGRIEFQVCANSTCTAAGDPAVSGTSSSTALVDGSTGTWTVSSTLAAGTYWWRARAIDQLEVASGWSGTWSLTIGTPSITVAVSSATLALGALTPGSDSVTSVDVSVTTDAANGYLLTARDESDTWGADSSVTAQIADWTGTDATPSTWAPGTAGYMGWTVLDATGGRLAKWGSGTGTSATDFTNNRYVGLEGTTDVVVHSRSTYSPATDTVKMTARVNVAASQTAGNYDATMTVTATANP